MSDPIVSSAWLAERLGDPALSVFDASWHMPASGRDPKAEYRAGHIPGARFFDLEAVRDTDSPWPHMLPCAAAFQAWARAEGVRAGGMIVAYDADGLFSAARLWWMVKAFGAGAAFVLDGGLRAWRAEDRPLESGAAASVAPGNISVRLDLKWLRSLSQMRDNLERQDFQVADARSAARFAGAAPEPRPGLRSGHIPGSANIPFDRLIDAQGRLRPADDLRAVFADAGVALDRPITSTCGSGVTAAIIALAIARLGIEPAPVYDGSWSEWGALADTPVATGAGQGAAA